MDNQSELIRVVQQGLAQVVKAIDGTNERIDATNQRLDGTNQRLDGIDGRLDDLTTELREFRVEVRGKFDGIGTYLQSIDEHIIHNQGDRIYKLERRVEDIEKKFGT